MGCRIKVKMRNSLYNEVEELARKVGMPVARLITMMLADSIMNTKLEIEVDGKSKIKDKRINSKYVNVSISDEIYDIIIGKIEGKIHYCMNDYVVDCIDYQLGKFKKIMESTFNQNYIQSRRISKSVSVEKGQKYYSENVRKKYKVVSPLDEYITLLQVYSGVKSGYIQRYFLAKQIGHILSEYGDDEIDFFNAENDYGNV